MTEPPLTPWDIADLAERLLAQHGLDDWCFAFNRQKRGLGLCRFGQKRIELSIYFVAVNSRDAIVDTLLHEIAHALAGHQAGHGPKWKQVCLKIGCKPERCDRESTMPLGRWLAICPGCGQRFHRHRRPMRNRTYSCRKCGPTRGALKFGIVQARTAASTRPASNQPVGLPAGKHRDTERQGRLFDH